MKRCTACGELKLVSEFRQKQARCKPCQTAYVAEWKRSNPEKAAANAARYRDNHREQRRADSLDRYHRLMSENPAKVRQQRRDWAKTEKGVLANRGARHRRRGAALSVEAKQWWQNLKVKTCWYCGSPADEIDHIIPISRGGDGSLRNVVPACRSCNAQKNDRDAREFLGVA